MAGRALGLEICLARFGIANHNGRRPHSSRIAAINFEFVNEPCDIGYLFRSKGKLVLVRRGTFEKWLQHFAIPVAHYIVGAQQIGPAVFSSAGILAVTVSAVGHIRSLAAGDAGRIARRPRRELAGALNRRAPRRHSFFVSLSGEIYRRRGYEER